LKTAGAGSRHLQFQHPLPGGQPPSVEAVGLIDPLIMPLLGMGVDKLLPFFQQNGLQKTLMILFHLLFKIFKEELF
jgi:hypothetical protein